MTNANDEKESPASSLLAVFTGDGKGKTTAALGTLWRALGWGQKTAMVQFIKGKWKTGERIFAERLPELEWHVMGRGFTWKGPDMETHRLAAAQAWERSRELIAGEAFDLIVLDEFTHALNKGFVDLNEALEFLRARPARANVIITGRDAPEALLAIADLATEMKVLRHPYDRGVAARKGFDF